MIRKPVLIISPSGNFYGSEQVLMDYLITTKTSSDVFAPAGSTFFQILIKNVKAHRVMSFNNRRVSFFYAKVFYWLITGRYKVIYLNEAGHSKYILALSKVFRSAKFVIHVRIKEDTEDDRWNVPGPNVILISISKYIKSLLSHKSVLMYDPYIFSTGIRNIQGYAHANIIKVGIIGRLSYTKGIIDLLNLLQFITVNKVQGFQFLLFGDEGSDIRGKGILDKIKNYPCVFFKGFEQDKNTLYKQIDIVLHLSRTEPLGRIFFEAIEKNRPFVGYNKAGISEIGDLAGLQSWLVDVRDDEDVSSLIFEKLEHVKNNYVSFVQEINQKKPLIESVFNIDKYTERMDSLLSTSV